MLSNAMGLILADNSRVHLGELSQPRALAAVPFAGRYRIIDFMLSNMVNSGIKRVGVVALTKYKSLMDHLGTGASWDLDRMQQGLSILPPYINSVAQGPESNDLTGLLDFMAGSRHKYVVIADSNVVMNTTLDDFLAKHEESGADLTIMYNRDSNKFGSPAVMIDLDRRGVMRDLMIDPNKPKTTRCSLGIAVIARDRLMDLISEAIARGQRDFSIEKLLAMYEDQLQVRGYEHKGLALRINSVATYFTSSMRLLEDDVMRELFWDNDPVYTKVKNEAPALYEEGNVVVNSLLSDGCHIYGEVVNSILFRDVVVAKHARVENCVLMQGVQISEGVEIKNAIIDKDTVLRTGVRLQGLPDYPAVIGKGVVV